MTADDRRANIERMRRLLNRADWWGDGAANPLDRAKAEQICRQVRDEVMIARWAGMPPTRVCHREMPLSR